MQKRRTSHSNSNYILGIPIVADQGCNRIYPGECYPAKTLTARDRAPNMRFPDCFPTKIPGGFNATLHALARCGVMSACGAACGAACCAGWSAKAAGVRDFLLEGAVGNADGRPRPADHFEREYVERRFA